MEDENAKPDVMRSEAYVLTRFLSLSGLASRRKCVDIIKEGRVEVNGRVVCEPGCRVLARDQVLVDGVRVEINLRRHYIMLDKPRGYVCSNDDPHASKTIFDLIDLNQSERLFCVGRLDKDSEGLLLVTNDGDFANRITHPRYGVEKTYLVDTDRRLAENELDRLRMGVHDDGEFLRPISVMDLGDKCYRFVMGDGKKREIRRLVASTGAKVNRLRRVAVGGLKLTDLESGKWRYLSAEEKERCLR